jgi:succinyl-diaminopimelate desuccinylase
MAVQSLPCEDPVALTAALVDIESVSGNEKEITDAVEFALAAAPHLRVERVGNVLQARTELGRAQRVILAGHLDTVPLHDNFPSTVDGEVMYGCGTSDMKSGSALALHLAVTVPEPVFDVTYLFYDCEEIEAERNGLNAISQSHPSWLEADFACSSPPTVWSRPAARARCGPTSGSTASGPTRPGRGAGSTRSMARPRC